MEIYIDRTELKKESKKLLDGKTWILFLCNLCFIGIATVIAYAVFFIPNPLEKILTAFIYEKDVPDIYLFIFDLSVEWLSWSIYIFIRSIIFVALLSPFYVCLATVPLAIVNNEKIEVAKIFAPIRKSRYFIEYAIAGVQKYLCIILWTLLIILPGIMAHYRYGYAKYIFATTNEITAGEAIAKSKKLTDGNKGQLFSLDFSFIGWFLIGVITCGLGLVFVLGYHEIVTAMYYKKITESSVSDEKKEVQS